ncbi:MAG: sulfatase [Verrucomicrobia bacterium]|jgi:choline-sulfatase|nr:sulfatase [Verrucomicrobiota bacterium]MBT7065726.1 sulfatase [Verrucomicrobiota bacterium]MBT7699491.1 sulfatase [Verrucomicrobiota bacterium]
MRAVILDLDTLRPDHLGCYGYHRDTSPAIDRIASMGTRFDNYYTPDAPCLPSRASLMSGQFGIHHGAVGHGGTAADMRLQGGPRGFRSDYASNSLWMQFRHAGMHTCSISPFAERHSSFWFLAGLNEMHNHIGKGGDESAEEVTPIVMQWLDEHAADDNWMLHVNYWDPHTPYRAPASFGNPFEGEPLPEWLTEDVLKAHTALAGPHTARDNGMYTGTDNPAYPRHPNDVKDMEQLRRCIDGYDCGIRFMDDHIAMILEKLESVGILEDTAIIVTSDHGENFGELGVYSEHGTADHPTCRIPMIIKWPGLPAGQVDTGLHYNLDLAPTIADLLGQKPWDRWDGRSYATTLRTGADSGREALILSQNCHVCQRSVRWDRWLYMRTAHDGFHPHYAEEMLFDIEADPHETTDLTATHPDIIAEGRTRLAAWKTEMMASLPEGYVNDPMDTVLAEGGPQHARVGHAPIKAYFERLRATGRADKIEAILARHPSLR